MRFTLEIEMGNEAMQTNADVAGALVKAAEGLVPEFGMDWASIKDDNGNTVGGYGFQGVPTPGEYNVSVIDGRLRASSPASNGQYLWYDIDSPIIASALETALSSGRVSPQEIYEYADQHGLTDLYELVGGPMVDNLQTVIESASEPYGLGPVSG